MARGRALRGIFGTMLERVLRSARRSDHAPHIPRSSVKAPDAGREATEYANTLRGAQPPPGWGRRSWPPSTVVAAVDRRTGRVYRGHSAEPGVDVPEGLRRRLPASDEAWPADNCGEVKAAARALTDGADLHDLQFAAVHGRTGRSRPPCRNCRQWIPGGGDHDAPE